MDYSKIIGKIKILFWCGIEVDTVYWAHAIKWTDDIDR